MPTTEELFDLSGHIAVVTGAGSGLGSIFSQALAEAGADVVCADVNLEGADETAAMIETLGKRALVMRTDVTREADVNRLVEEARRTFGRLDVMVNNAGIATAGPPETLPIDDWQHVIDVNLTGVFLGARAAARTMIATGIAGRIINIASILGAVASEPVPAAAYAASKGAVVNLTRDLAVHWAPHGIRVNALGPAYFPSAMTKDFLSVPEIRQEVERRTPLGRTGCPDELKGPIIFLASAASSYVTGHALYVDGGWTA